MSSGRGRPPVGNRLEYLSEIQLLEGDVQARTMAEAANPRLDMSHEMAETAAQAQDADAASPLATLRSAALHEVEVLLDEAQERHTRSSKRYAGDAGRVSRLARHGGFSRADFEFQRLARVGACRRPCRLRHEHDVVRLQVEILLRRATRRLVVVERDSNPLIALWSQDDNLGP